MTSTWPQITDDAIRRARPAKAPVDPRRPYACLVEPECSASGEVVQVATLFLVNRECPWRCLMCDLWRNTLDGNTPPGAIAEQIDFALAQLPPAQHVKLYNSGNFSDPRAVPPQDYPAIAERLRGFTHVVVENHPQLCGQRTLAFQRQLEATLEVAVGLETVHPEVLPRLNKGLTLADFAKAVDFLRTHGMAVRAFVLLRPPYLNEEEGVEWALRSLEYAFRLGVNCCSVIPTRAGNGILDRLAEQGLFQAPSLRSLERVMEEGLAQVESIPDRPRVFVDLWDAAQLRQCRHCGPTRVARLQRMNLSQRMAPPIVCAEEHQANAQ